MKLLRTTKEEKIIEHIENLLKAEGIEFVSDGLYINIMNSSTATRIKVWEFRRNEDITEVAVEVQEFDFTGRQTYSKEFYRTGKAFMNRIKRNLG